MKKILFTAIAMVAFAGTGFAANEVVEKVTVVNAEDNCDEQRANDLAYYESLGYDCSEAEIRANQNYSKCVDNATNNGNAESKRELKLTKL